MTNWPSGGETLATWTVGCSWLFSGGAGEFVSGACVVARWILGTGEFGPGPGPGPGWIVLVGAVFDVMLLRMLHSQPASDYHSQDIRTILRIVHLLIRP